LDGRNLAPTPYWHAGKRAAAVEAGILPASRRGFQPRDPFAVVRMSKLRPAPSFWEIHFARLPAMG